MTDLILLLQAEQDIQAADAPTRPRPNASPLGAESCIHKWRNKLHGISQIHLLVTCSYNCSSNRVSALDRKIF
jgi:hypothetical protein